MPKGTKTLGNSKALAWESRGFVHKKEDVYILTHPLLLNLMVRYQPKCATVNVVIFSNISVW